MTAPGGAHHPPPTDGDGHPAVAVAMSVATAVVTAAAVALVLVTRPTWTVWQWYFVVDIADAAVFGAVGYVLLSRSRHGVAWIVAGTGLGGALAAFGAQWTELAAARPGVPALPDVQALQNWAWVPGTMALLLVVPWLVRPGALGPLARAATAFGVAVIAALWLLRVTDPAPWPDDAATPPLMRLAIHRRDWVAVIERGVPAAYLVSSAGGLLAAAAVARRWRRSAPDARRGLGWLALGVTSISLSFVPLGLPESWVDFLPTEFTPLSHLASHVFFPGALLVAVLGQRLWGVRLAVSRTLVWSLLTAALVVAYVALVALSGLVFPGLQSGVGQVGVTAVLAAAIGPLRRFVQRRVDHLIHGEGIEPAYVLGRVGRSIGAGGSPSELLGAVLRDVVSALRLRGASIDITALGTDLRSVAVGDTSGDTDGGLDVTLVLDEQPIGALHLWPRPGERIDGQTERTIAALTPLVSVAARLAATAVQLSESRARLASARDQERRALRRELHDGLGPALAGVGYGLRATRNLLANDPAAAGELLDRLADELDTRVAEVRNLARELVPPVLLEEGLAAALAELVDRQRMTGLAVELDVAALPPIPDDIATAFYAVAVEALRNVVRHASASSCRVTLRAPSPGEFVLEVADDGVGLPDHAPTGVGTQSMRERAEALGARLTIGPGPTRGTLVTMHLDLADATVAR